MSAHQETSSCEEIKDSREIKGCEEVNSAVLGKVVLAKRSSQKRDKDSDVVKYCCSFEEIKDCKEIRRAKKLRVEGNREKIKVGKNDEDFSRRGSCEEPKD